MTSSVSNIITPRQQPPVPANGRDSAVNGIDVLRQINTPGSVRPQARVDGAQVAIDPGLPEQTQVAQRTEQRPTQEKISVDRFCPRGASLCPERRAAATGFPAYGHENPILAANAGANRAKIRINQRSITSSHPVLEDNMSTRTCKVGIHGRNHEEWHDVDFRVLRDAGVEVIKPMSQTRPHHFERMKRELPNVEIITRLHGDGFGVGHHPSPGQFAGQMIPVMANLRPSCTKFHVHNEPNHVARYEGWGNSDDDARNFNAWFLEVYQRLKEAHPWASLGFPGLALPHFGHRDWQWLDICRPAIERADWLGVHCYWQTPPGQGPQLMHEALGMNFKHYHDKYPNKTLEILECGNSNIQNNYPISDEAVADEYVQWLQEVFKYPYVNSASFFILSSQDTSNWSFFS